MKAKSLDLGSEIHIDTITAKCSLSCAMVGKEYGWTHEGKGDYYHKFAECGNTSAYLIFKPRKGQAGLNPKEGTIKVQVSLPKAMYGQNITGFRHCDKNIFYGLVHEMLIDNNIFTQGPGTNISFDLFSVCRFDWSLSFFNDESSEVFELFKKLKFGECIAGSRNEDDGDYETGYYHGSKGMEVLLYDKTTEIEENSSDEESNDEEGGDKENSDEEIDDEEIANNIWRIEVRKKSDKKRGFDITVDKLLKTSNGLFEDWLSSNPISPFLPKADYFDLLKTQYEKAKEENKDRSYCNRKWTTLVSLLEEINRSGCYEFYNNNKDDKKEHEKRKKNYNTCKSLASDAGIPILYTTKDSAINIFENICTLADYDKTFSTHSNGSKTSSRNIETPSDNGESTTNIHTVFDLFSDIGSYRAESVDWIYNINTVKSVDSVIPTSVTKQFTNNKNKLIDGINGIIPSKRKGYVKHISFKQGSKKVSTKSIMTTHIAFSGLFVHKLE